MDKERIKAATTGRAPGRSQATSPEAESVSRPTNVTDALSGGQSVTLGGRVFHLSPLDFNDLIVCEDHYETVMDFLSDLSDQKLRAVRFFLWLMFRKTDPDLAAEEVGALIPANLSEIRELLMTAARVSGFASESDPNARGISGGAEVPTGS